MLGSRYGKARSPKSEGEKPFWISFADFMTALMTLFLVVMAVSLIVVTKKINEATRCWNPAKEDQATDRAYRIGQKRDVTVYYPTIHTSQFDTFEVKLDRLLSSKRKLAGDMLNGTGEISIKELADEVLR